MLASWKKLYATVKRIPRGRVIAYGGLARVAKLRGGAREAGRAMGVCPKGEAVPWQRVVGAGGRILIREPLAALQRKLLESEGVRFIGFRVDMAAHEWKPKRVVKRR